MSMRILTRGDLDGLTCSVFLTELEDVREIRFGHPKDVQDGLVPCDERDIVCNLPYVPGCALWFDHHVSEGRKLQRIGEFQGRFAIAPSCARVIGDHYGWPEALAPFDAMLEATDRVDAATLSMDEVMTPEGWVLLGLTLDPRSGLGAGFRKYFRWLVEYVKEVPLERVLRHEEVAKRTQRVLEERDAFLQTLVAHSEERDRLIVTDLREANPVPVGNRFLVFTLYPEANVEARYIRGKDGKFVIAVGHSIFNRTCRVNVGALLARYGGGGHRGAGTVQLDPGDETTAEEILGILRANEVVD